MSEREGCQSCFYSRGSIHCHVLAALQWKQPQGGFKMIRKQESGRLLATGGIRSGPRWGSPTADPIVLCKYQTGTLRADMNWNTKTHSQFHRSLGDLWLWKNRLQSNWSTTSLNLCGGTFKKNTNSDDDEMEFSTECVKYKEPWRKIKLSWVYNGRLFTYHLFQLSKRV